MRQEINSSIMFTDKIRSDLMDLLDLEKTERNKIR